MTAAVFPTSTVELNRAPIRVLELRTADGPGGGPEKTIIKGAKLSDPSEFDIRVVYVRQHNDECSHLRERAAAQGISYREIRTRGPLDWGAVRQLGSIVSADQPAIIHAHDYKSCLLAWLVARKLRLLATAHGWTGCSAREKYLYYPVEKFILRKFDHIVSVSSQITNELLSHGVPPHHVTTIPNAIDPEQFKLDKALRDIERHRLSLPADQFVIGTAGRLEKQKRFDLLIEAFAKTRADYPNSALLIAGDGSLRNQLQNQIDQLGIAPHCRLLGHVANIKNFYHAIDLFVQSSDYEGTPNVVLEAMAMRVPVIATLAGGTADVLRHGIDGVAVQTGSAECIANAILAARRDWDNTLSRVETARRRVETELSFATRNERLESVYRSLVASPNRWTALPMTATPPTTRVCFVIDRLLRGGTELHVLNLISSLDRTQVTPYLCLLDGADELSGELLPQNCQSIRLGVRRLCSLHAARQAVRFAQFLRRERIDVVQMYFPDSTRFAAPIAKVMGVRSVIGTRRNIGHWMTKRDQQIARLYNWLFIDKIITNCEAARQAVIEQERARPNHVEVVPNAIDLERFKHIPPWIPKPAGTPRKVGMVGNLRHVKGPDLFIEAAELVLEQFPDTQFEIAGGGDPAPYQQLIDERGIGQQVRLLGPINDVPAFLSDLDVAVLPSRAEGLSNALLEYMAAGRPIVATDVGGNREVIQNTRNGLISDVNKEALAANINSLLADPKGGMHYAEAARRVCHERCAGSQFPRYVSAAELARAFTGEGILQPAL